MSVQCCVWSGLLLSVQAYDAGRLVGLSTGFYGDDALRNVYSFNILTGEHSGITLYGIVLCHPVLWVKSSMYGTTIRYLQRKDDCGVSPALHTASRFLCRKQFGEKRGDNR